MSKNISRDEKKRRLEATQGAGGAEEQGEMESAAVEVAPVTITKWAGLENYECRLCAYATLDSESMVGHLRAVHNWVVVPLPNPIEEASAGLAGGDVEDEIQDEVK